MQYVLKRAYSNRIQHKNHDHLPEEVPVVLLLLYIIAEVDFNGRRILAVCRKLSAHNLTMVLPALMMMVEALMHARPAGSDAYRGAMRDILR